MTRASQTTLKRASTLLALALLPIALVACPAARKNHAPQANDQTVTTSEDTPIEITLDIIDPDGDDLTCTITKEPEHGTLTGTEPDLTYTPDTDYTGNDTFTYTTCDGNLTSDEATITITVIGTNDAPFAQGQSVSTPEDTPVDISLTATDPDGDDLTYAIASDPEHGTLTGEPPILTYTPDTNYVGSDTFAFTASDDELTSNEASVTIQIGSVNDPPIAEDQAVSTAEDTPVTITLTATDPDGDDLTYNVVSQPSHGTLTAETPTLIYTPETDYAGLDTLTYTASDGTLTSTPATVTIDVGGTNDAPTSLDLSNTTIDENQPAGTHVGTFTTTDPDQDNDHTYTLVTGDGDDDNDDFAITDAILYTAATFDHEATPSKSIRVRTADPFDASHETSFTIAIEDVNEPPTSTTLSPRSIPENEPAGTLVGTLTTSDPDDADTHTYTLTTGSGDDDNHRFTLTSNELRTAEPLDHEATPTLTIRIHSEDQYGLSIEGAITINVSDVNEPPSGIGLDPTTFAENHPPGSTVGWLATNDPDASDQHAYALVEGAGDDANASFGIDGANVLVNTRTFDYEATTSLSVRIASTDQGGLDVEQAIRITITDIDEAPTLEMIRQLGTTGNDEALGIAVDANGDLFVGGYTTGSLHGESSVGGEDMVLVKYRATGTRLWTRQTGSTANERVNGIASDGGLNVYMTGWTAGSMHGESIAGRTDFFLVKYDGLGNRLWTRLHGSASDDGARNVTVDTHGNVYVTGYTWNAMDGNSYAGGGDLFVTKYGSDGTRLWTRQRGTPSWDEGNSVVADASGNVYIAGVTRGSLDGHSNAGDRDIFIVKYDASGNWQWTRQFGSAEEDVAMDVALDGDGNLYLAGWTAGAIAGQASHGNDDVVIAKYQLNGARLWIRTPGTSADDRAYTVTTGAAGHAYVTANTLGMLGDHSNAGSWDVAVLRYDQDGLLQGARQFGTPSSDRVLESATGPMNRIYATGSTAGDLLEGAHIGGLDIFFVELAP